jgi:hypothetical protein
VRTVVRLCGGAAGASYTDVLMTQRAGPNQGSHQDSRGTTATLLSLGSYTRIDALTWRDDEHLTQQYAAGPGDTHHRGPPQVLGVHVTYENAATPRS